MSMIRNGGGVGGEVGDGYFGFSPQMSISEPVWPDGKALGRSADGLCFHPLGLSFLLKTGGLWTLSCDFAHTINETFKWLTQLPALMQNHSGGDSVVSMCEI